MRKGVDLGVFFYSRRNCGQNIVICADCIVKFSEMLVKYVEEKDV